MATSGTHVMVLEMTAAIRPWCRVVSRKCKECCWDFGKERNEKDTSGRTDCSTNLHDFWQVLGLTVGSSTAHETCAIFGIYNYIRTRINI